MKMDTHILKSSFVCHNSERFLFIIGFKHYNFGIQIHKWGIRLMLIWWHICIHLND
jgi:hypothetical protein